MDYICHSGGCPGADMEWENEALKYGIETIAYSFPNHVQYGRNPRILTMSELNQGYERVLYANRTLKRDIEKQPVYIKNLLNRNWFQIKNSDVVFAIIKKFLTNHTVDGGTGWAVQMAIDCDKPVFVFYQDTTGGGWFRYMPIVGFESLYGEIPTIPQNFAGIGTRNLNEYGVLAIKNILKHNFSNRV